MMGRVAAGDFAATWVPGNTISILGARVGPQVRARKTYCQLPTQLRYVLLIAGSLVGISPIAKIPRPLPVSVPGPLTPTPSLYQGLTCTLRHRSKLRTNAAVSMPFKSWDTAAYLGGRRIILYSLHVRSYVDITFILSYWISTVTERRSSIYIDLMISCRGLLHILTLH